MPANLPVPYAGSLAHVGSSGPPTVPVETRGTVLFGFALILSTFGAFGSWAALAPLRSAAVASGVVIVESEHKTVQHLEGGIVREIRFTDGDRVREGDVLMVLDKVNASATHERILSSVRNFAAQAARLKAERSNAAAVSFDHPMLASASDPEVAEILRAQTSQFESRRENHQKRKSILAQSVGQLRSQIDGLDRQVRSTLEQLRLINAELSDVTTLVEKGLALRPRQLALERARASLQGTQGDLMARIAQARERIIQTDLQLLGLDAERAKDIDAEFAGVQANLADFEERMKSSKAILLRSDVLAPVGGKIINMRIKTVGGVVRPGDPILEIVPDQDRLIVEAQVQPNDIDVVHSGLNSQVRFSAYSFRRTPSARGRVEYVSADRVVNAATQKSYYVARVSIDPEEFKELHEVKLYPGMPVDVLIETGERTVAEAVLAPILDSMVRSFREQ